MSRKVLFLLLLLTGLITSVWTVHHLLDSGKEEAEEAPTIQTGRKMKIKDRLPQEERFEEEETPPASNQIPAGPKTEVPAAAPPTDKGFEYLQKGEIPNAKDFFLEHVTLHPIDPQGHFGLGVVYRTEEEFVPAVEEFAKTILLDPMHVQATLQLADMLTFQMKDDFESAEQLYEEVLEQVPEEKSVLNGLASVYLSTGRVDQAIDTWEGLRNDMPEQEAIAKNLAEAYVVKARQEQQAGNGDQANQWIARAKELNPQVSVDEGQ